MTLDRDWIVQRISNTDTFSERPAVRGDHDLNPDLRPELRSGPPLRRAAVLVGLVERTEGLTILLTRRTDHLEHHPGQISFPGGHVEAADADAVATALRETEEEIGLAPAHIEVLGRLDTYITRTGFEITPVVALIKPPFELVPDTHEVAEVFEVPMPFLMNPSNHLRHLREFEGAPRYFYAMPYEDYYIWGATAGMIMDLYQTLTDSPQ